MTQDTFNKIITLSFMIFFMVMYAVSFFMNRPLDLAGVFGFLVPMVTHIIHITKGNTNA